MRDKDGRERETCVAYLRDLQRVSKQPGLHDYKKWRLQSVEMSVEGLTTGLEGQHNLK